MNLSGADYRRFEKLILDGTENGPITEWVERIALLSKKIGLPVQHMNWNTSPSGAAYKVIESANAYDKLEELEAELKK